MTITSLSYSRVIRIKGERALGNNKVSRFNQEIPVPPNFEIEKIQARFQNGILTITMPKIVPPKPTIREQVAKTIPETTPSISKAPADQPPKDCTTEAEKQKIAQKGEEEEAVEKTKTESKSQKDEDNISSKQYIPTTSKAPEKPQSQKVQESITLTKPTITAVAENQKDDKSVTYQPMQEKVQEAAVQKTMTEPEAKKADEKKIGELKETGKVVDRTLQKEMTEKELKKLKESILADEKVVQKVAEKVKETISKKIDGSAEEKPKEEHLTAKYMTGIKNVKDKAKEAVNNVLKKANDEDMQLWVNVGAAVLVIVAFGAYASYSYRSSGQSKK